MIRRAYRRFDKWLVAQCATREGYRRAWTILTIVTMAVDILMYAMYAPVIVRLIR